MLVVIDNYDSFTYNLVQMITAAGKDVRVVKNDQVAIEEMEGWQPEALVISPGPGTPCDAGISMEAISYFAPHIPILGVCLGHQAIAGVFGGKVVRNWRIMHGKVSWVNHDGQGIYQGIANPFKATRYHSLAVDPKSLPDCLEVSAWSDEGEIMGLRHKAYPVEGVQFHPESIMTVAGKEIISNFLALKDSYTRQVL